MHNPSFYDVTMLFFRHCVQLQIFILQFFLSTIILILLLVHGDNVGWVDYLGDNNEEFHDIPLEWKEGSQVSE